MARICIDARPAVIARGTGIGNYTYQLIQYLAVLDDQHDYYLLWPDDGTKPLPMPPRFHFHPMSRDRRKEAEQLPRWLESQGIELYHAPDNGLHAFPSYTCPMLVTIHDLIPFVMPETVRRGYRRNFLEKVPKIAREACGILTVSEVAKRDIHSILGIPQERIRVIYPAQEAVFVPGDPDLARCRLYQLYGISSPYILYTGGLNPRKNVAELIYAFAKARKYWDREVQLVIPGEFSDQAERLPLLCQALGVDQSVLFLGFVPMDDIVTLYQGARLFAYPSLYEGFGLPPLEAMACGVPVITSPVPSVTEAAKGAALLFNPEDTTSLIDRLNRGLWEVPLRETMRQRGLAAVSPLSWEKTAAETLAVYNEILGAHRHNEGQVRPIEG
ncbi:MAG: glycosyltransferase family 4 protein [Firmicutes bacterium]|nr:glycosyltransferase family 4 protein [Bacillota bacterium]